MRQAHDEYLREFEGIRDNVDQVGPSNRPLEHTPIRRNPAPADVFPLPPVTPDSSFLVNQHTVEELTAMQLATVYRYVGRYESEYLPSNLSPANEMNIDTRASVLSIANSLELLRRTSDNASRLITQLANTVTVLPPDSISFSVFTAWAQEIVHALTAMSVHRDVLQEGIIPCFVDESYRTRLQDAFRRCKISVAHILSVLTRASGLSAFLTRYLRAIETAQIAVIANLKGGEPDAHNFIADVQQAPPGDLPTTEVDFTQTLQWWRNNYSRALSHDQTKQIVDRVSKNAEESARALQPNLPPQPTPAAKPKFKSGGFGPRTPQTQTTSASAPMSSPAGVPTSSRSREDGRASSSSVRGGRGPSVEAGSRRYRQDSVGYPSSGRVRGPPREPPSPPSQERPTESQPPCVFCSSRRHFSAECHYYRRLTERANVLRDCAICSNCLKQHYGICSRREKCLLCSQRGHHQAICVLNRHVIVDITTNASRFYEDVARDTYFPTSRDLEARQPCRIVRQRSRSQNRRRGRSVSQRGRSRGPPL